MDHSKCSKCRGTGWQYIHQRKVKDKCERCEGYGIYPDKFWNEMCDECGGVGTTYESPYVSCSACNGVGYHDN